VLKLATFSSTLPDTATLSNGKIPMPHYTNKAKIEQYIKKIGLPAIFVAPGYYMDNLSWYGVTKSKDGVVVFNFPLKPETKMAAISIPDDFGPVVAEVLRDRAKWLGKRVPIHGDEFTIPQMAAIYQKVTGQPTKFVPQSLEELEKEKGNAMAQNMQWVDEYGCFFGDDVSLTKEIKTPLTTFEEWLKKSGFRV